MANSTLQVTYKTKKTGTGTQELTKEMGQAQMSLTDIKSGLEMAGKAFGAVQAAVQSVIDPTVEYAGQVRELQRTIGASAEEASKLIQAADDVGISAQTVQAALEAAIKKGVKPTIAGIADLADQYNDIQDPIARTKFLMDKFGKSGADLAPLMEQGAAGIKAAGDEAERLGLVMDQQGVDSAREYEIAMDNFNDSILAVKLAIAQGLLPAVSSAIEQGAQYVQVWKNVFEAMGDGRMSLLDYLKTSAQVVWTDKTLADVNADLTAGLVARKAALEADTARWAGLADQYDKTATAAGRLADGSRYQAYADAVGAAANSNFELAKHAGTATTNQDLSGEAATRAAAAQAAAQKSLDDRVTGYYNLAAALKDATALELAQTELGQIQQLFDDGVISQEEYKTATENVGLAFGIFTPQSLALAGATDKLTRLYASGKITADELTTATGLLTGAAADGKVDMEELGISVDTHVTPAFSAARDQAELFEGAMNRLDGRTVSSTVITNFVQTGATAGGTVPVNGQQTYTNDNAFAGGADFVVPPGYPNDSYPMRVESGEHVVVTPAGQSGGGGGDTFYVTINAGSANSQQVADLLNQQDIRRRTGARS